MADAIVVRNGKGSAAVVGPTDDRESSATVADRQSVSSCSSQETVLGAGDDRCCRRADLPTGNGYENTDGGDVQTTGSGSEHIDGNTDNDDEDIFYDEQPQMALMSPLVTRWRRAQAGGGSKVDSANNNSLLLSNGKQSCHQRAHSNQLTNAAGVVTTSGSGSGSGSGRTCPPMNTHVVDGYATLRNRKSASDKSPSITGNSSGNDLSGVGVSEGNAGMPRFPTSRGDNRFPLSSTLTTANPTTVNRKLDEVDTKALQQLHQPWRRVTSYGSDGEHKSSTRKLPNIAQSPSSVEIKLGPLAKSSVGNGNCVGTGCGGGGGGGGNTASRAPLAATNSYDVDGRSKRKPAVGKLSLFDRLPAFMLQSHQTKQQPHPANSCSSAPSSSAVTPLNSSSPKATAATTSPSFASTRRSPDAQHLTQSTRVGAQLRKKPGSVTKTAGIQPPKFDDTDEEALSPMVTSTYSPSGNLPDVTCGDVSQPSSVFESSPLPPGCSPATSTDRGGLTTCARSPSTDRLPLGGGDRPPYAGLLPFPVMSDSVSTVSCHSNNNGRQNGDSPRSAISSYETTDEQNNAAEIRRLRQDLKWAREQVQLFTARLSTNTSVVEAFDQSLCNMASRLQRIASSNLLDVGELGELHATICTLRRQNWSQLPPDRGPIDMSLTPPLPSPPRTPVSLTHEPWQHLQQQQQQQNGMHGASAATQGVVRTGARDILRRQTSSESVASVGSASSAISSLSVQTTCGVESGDHKHRTVKNWLRSSFGKAFARRKTAPRDSSIGRSTASSSVSIVGSEGSVRRDGGPAYTGGSMPTIADPTAMYNASRRVSAGDRHGSASTIGGPDVSRPMASFPEIPSSRMHGHLSGMSFVRGSETRSSKTSIMSLPARTMTAPLTSSKPMSDIVGSDELLFDGRRAMTTSHKRSESVGQTVALPRFTSNDSIRSSREGTAMLSEVPPLVSGGHRLAVSVFIRSPGGTDVVKLKAGCSQTKDLVIGSVTVNCSTTWLQLDRLIRRTFQDYLIRLDPATSIGLSGESVHSYRIGEVVRRKESDQPELLPIGYVVGDVSNISITLKGSTENAVDRLAFELLVPKLILQRYVSLLIEHRRVILSGSTGTGKTFLAQRLAEFIVETCGVEATPDNVAVFQVDNQSSRELRHYLTNIAGQCTAVADSTTATTTHDDDDDDDALGVRYRSPLTTTTTTTTLPRVVILDNLHRVSSLSDVFNGFLSVPYQCCPYVIGTMNQTTSCSAADLQMHHNFRWVLYANHIEPVRSFLGRFLRRQHMSSVTMATLAATSPIRNIVGLKDHRQQQQQQQQGSSLTGNVVDATSGGGSGSGDAGRVVDWLPKVWLRINQFLEAHTSCDITIGPRLFLSCPMDFAQAEVWFADLWNYSIVPYMLEAVRDGIQGHGCRGQWEELADWVTETYPWRVGGTSNHNGNQSPHHQMKTSTPLSDSVSHSSSSRPSVGTGSASCTAMLSLPLLRLRLEDVGYGGGVTSTGVSHVTRRGTTTTTALQPPPEMDDEQVADDVEELDPLTDMLARLQEAALRYSDHDSDGSESVIVPL